MLNHFHLFTRALPIFLLALLLASCDPGVDGKVSVHNATRDTVKVQYRCGYCNSGQQDSVICYPDSTRLLFTYFRIGMVRYIRLDDELDTIAITGFSSGRQYQASRDEANWNITRTAIGWFGGGTVVCVYEVKD